MLDIKEVGGVRKVNGGVTQPENRLKKYDFEIHEKIRNRQWNLIFEGNLMIANTLLLYCCFAGYC